MMFLISVAAFLLAIAILVTFHEYGHYWVARRCGVKVLRFSVGFGRPLWSWISPKTGTEWVLAAWPLGGYVKMLDARDPEAEVSEELKSVEFTGKPLYMRAAIIAAGPAFNLVLAVLLYALVFMVGSTEVRPLVGSVAEGSPAATAGLRAGDEILEVDGESVVSWQAFLLPLLDSGMSEGVIPLTVYRENSGYLYPVIDVGPGLLKHKDVLAMLGLAPLRATSRPVIGQVQSGSAAEVGGLQVGDRLLRMNGQPVSTWENMTAAIRARPGETLHMEFKRGQKILESSVLLEVAESVDGQIGRLGVTAYRDPQLAERLQVTVRHSVGDSLWLGLHRTWQFSELTVRLIGQLISGQAALSNLSGPIGIAEYAGMSAMAGGVAFLGMLALLSVSLGILNLLPIPILDGGHLLYCLIEAVTRRPVAAWLEQMGQRVGVAMLVVLMGLALYNDLARIWG